MTLRKGSTLHLTGWQAVGDIRFIVLSSDVAEDTYTLQTVGAKHTFIAEGVGLRARLRSKELTIEQRIPA